MTERAYGQVGLLSPDSERGDSFGTAQKTIELVRPRLEHGLR